MMGIIPIIIRALGSRQIEIELIFDCPNEWFRASAHRNASHLVIAMKLHPQLQIDPRPQAASVQWPCMRSSNVYRMMAQIAIYSLSRKAGSQKNCQCFEYHMSGSGLVIPVLCAPRLLVDHLPMFMLCNEKMGKGMVRGEAQNLPCTQSCQP